MVADLLLFAVTGAVAGTAAGLLGIGGGIVVVPCLAYAFHLLGFKPASIMHMASATSLAAMIFTACMSTYSHSKRGAVRWDIFRQLLPGVVFGVIFGMVLAFFLSTKFLQILFGVFLLFISAIMLLNRKPKATRSLPNATGNFAIASIIGGKSGLLGVGGGSLMIPYLIYCNIDIREASGTAAACGLPIACFGTLSAMVTGWQAGVHHAYSLGFVFWPAAIVVAIFSMIFVFFGAKLSKILPVLTIKRIFAVVLLLAALDLLL